MMEVPLEAGFLVYVFLLLAGLGAAVIRDMWRARVHHWEIAEAQLGHCQECNLTFIVRREQKVARCPRCQALCQNRRR